MSDNQAKDQASQEYIPKSSGPLKSYKACLLKVGFSLSDTTKEKQAGFISALKNHVDHSGHKYLKPKDNAPAFNTMVDEFLAKHGEEYWGLSDREHLAEKDVSKGFLYLRDAVRPQPNLVAGLRAIFNYKAQYATAKLKHTRKTGCSKKNGLSSGENPEKDTSSRPLPSNHEGRITNADNEEVLSHGPRSKEHCHQLEPYQPVEAHKDKKEIHRPGNSAQEPPSIPTEPRETHREIRRRTQPVPTRCRGSSSDSDKSLPQRRQSFVPFTPPRSRISSTRHESHEVIDLDSDIETNQNIKRERSTTSIATKAEWLPSNSLNRTYLRISAENMPTRGPVRVPLSVCKTSDELFTSLLAERKIPRDLRNSISDITASFKWSLERIGIRKGRDEDWAYFCEFIRKAWEKDGSRFQEGCDIDIMIHIDFE
ncbi:hypothetical protein ACLMJK_006769 [Lecanora helva]